MALTHSFGSGQVEVVHTLVSSCSPSRYHQPKDFEAEATPCAILSHTWSDEEISFQDLRRPLCLHTPKATGGLRGRVER